MFAQADFDGYRKKTLEPFSKSAVFDYMMRTLYANHLNHKNFAYSILKEYWFINNIVMYMQKDFYLVDDFNEIISRLTSSGLISYWVSNEIRLKEKTTESSLPMGLNVSQMQGIFEVWLYGLMVSSICALLEIIFKKLSAALGLK